MANPSCRNLHVALLDKSRTDQRAIYAYMYNVDPSLIKIVGFFFSSRLRSYLAVILNHRLIPPPKFPQTYIFKH